MRAPPDISNLICKFTAKILAFNCWLFEHFRPNYADNVAWNGWWFGVLHPSGVTWHLKPKRMAIFLPDFDPTIEIPTLTRLLFVYKCSKNNVRCILSQFFGYFLASLGLFHSNREGARHSLDSRYGQTLETAVFLQFDASRRAYQSV